MDFKEFKQDIVKQLRRSIRVTGFNPNERELSQIFKNQQIEMAEIVCDILEEYDKRKQTE